MLLSEIWEESLPSAKQKLRKPRLLRNFLAQKASDELQIKSSTMLPVSFEYFLTRKPEN